MSCNQISRNEEEMTSKFSPIIQESKENSDESKENSGEIKENSDEIKENSVEIKENSGEIKENSGEMSPIVNQKLENSCKTCNTSVDEKNCSSSLKIFETPCGHKFDYDSMRNLLTISKSCPICKKQIINQDIQNRYSVKTFVPPKREFTLMSFMMYMLGGTIQMNFLVDKFMEDYIKDRESVLNYSSNTKRELNTKELFLETIKFLTLQCQLRDKDHIQKIIRNFKITLFLIQICLSISFMLLSSGPLVLSWFLFNNLVIGLTFFLYSNTKRICKEFYRSGRDPRELILSIFGILSLYILTPVLSLIFLTNSNILFSCYFSIFVVLTFLTILTLSLVSSLLILLNFDQNNFSIIDENKYLDLAEKIINPRDFVSVSELISSSSKLLCPNINLYNLNPTPNVPNTPNVPHTYTSDSSNS